MPSEQDTGFDLWDNHLVMVYFDIFVNGPFQVQIGIMQSN